MAGNGINEDSICEINDHFNLSSNNTTTVGEMVVGAEAENNMDVEAAEEELIECMCTSIAVFLFVFSIRQDTYNRK